MAAGGPPTRRQLRLQQLKEQAVTSANPVVAPAPLTEGGPKSPAAPAQQPAASPKNACAKVCQAPDVPCLARTVRVSRTA